MSRRLSTLQLAALRNHLSNAVAQHGLPLPSPVSQYLCDAHEISRSTLHREYARNRPYLQQVSAARRAYLLRQAQQPQQLCLFDETLTTGDEPSPGAGGAA